MNKKLTCSQISALINFYLEGNLNPKLKEYVNLHLKNCPACRKKFEDIKKILKKYEIKTLEIQNMNKSEQQPTEISYKLSQYIDNELNSNENIKIKKMTISNPNTRKELESLYKYKTLLNSAYNKTKNDYKYDYSKSIIAKIQENNEYTTTYFYKLAALFILLITAIISGFVYLYF